MGLDAMIFIFWMLSFKPTFSLFSFTFIMRLFSFSSLSAIRVVSSAYLRLLIFLLAILIPVCASSSPAFHMMYTAYKEKAMAPLSSTLAWKIPWMEEPGGLQSMGSHRVGHDWATSLSLFTFMHWRRKWHPYFSVLAWRIPGMGKPGGLLSMRSHRVRHDLATKPSPPPPPLASQIMLKILQARLQQYVNWEFPDV